MGGGRRWVALIVAAVAAVAVLGVLATQLELSGEKERPCGTPLRIDLGVPTVLRQAAATLEAEGDDPTASAEARRLHDRAAALEDRCKDRQRLALLGLGAAGLVAVAAVAWSTYQLGRRAGRREEQQATDAA